MEDYDNVSLGLKYFNAREKIYNPLLGHESHVYMGLEEDIDIAHTHNANVKLLKDIIYGHNETNFKKEFFGLTPLQRSLMIARMLGFDFCQIEQILKMPREEIKLELDKAIESLVKLNVSKCETCKFRVKGDNKNKRDRCKIFGIRVQRSAYCFVYKRKADA